MSCKMNAPLVGMVTGCVLASLSVPANAVILFENPFDASAAQTAWCDPCSYSQPGTSGFVGGRVWDSFTLTAPSTLQSFRWIGRQTDDLTSGVNFEIAYVPYSSPIFSAHYDLASISIVNVNAVSERRLVSLPNIVLSAGTYWLTVYGPSLFEKHTWWGQVEASGDNSLLQYIGPDPEHPTGAIARRQDARFRIDGTLNPVPLPAALPLYGTGLGVLAFLAWRRRRQALAVG